MKIYDLAIAWNWEYDADFINGIEKHCSIKNLSTYQIRPDNLNQVMSELKNGELKFRAFFDRASDSDPDFIPLVVFMTEFASCLINPHHLVLHAIDKATMHLEFMTSGLNVPNTIILPPYNEQKTIHLTNEELNKLGKPFVIKPANTTGGGTGVILNAQSIDDINRARMEHINDKYLVQETIIPELLEHKRGWFRVYYAFTEIIPCWWDDKTHRYTELSNEDIYKFSLQSLYDIMKTIASICKLDFFSSEIVLTEKNKFVVVDYVNEVCDMRLQSKHYDGAIDEVVHRIEYLIANHVYNHLNNAII